MALVLKTSEPKGSESSNLSASAKNKVYYSKKDVDKALIICYNKHML